MVVYTGNFWLDVSGPITNHPYKVAKISIWILRWFHDDLYEILKWFKSEKAELKLPWIRRVVDGGLPKALKIANKIACIKGP